MVDPSENWSNLSTVALVMRDGLQETLLLIDDGPSHGKTFSGLSNRYILLIVRSKCPRRRLYNSRLTDLRLFRDSGKDQWTQNTPSAVALSLIPTWRNYDETKQNTGGPSTASARSCVTSYSSRP